MKMSTLKKLSTESYMATPIHYTIKGNNTRIWYTNGYMAIKKIMNTIDFCKDILGHIETKGSGKVVTTEKGSGANITKQLFEQQTSKTKRKLIATYNRETLIKLLQSMDNSLVSIYLPEDTIRVSLELRTKTTRAVLMPVNGTYMNKKK